MNRHAFQRCVKVWAMLGVSGIALAPAAALAQGSPAGQTEPGALSEVIVTAQRRAERISDVPISITALTGSELTSAGVSTNLDLTQVVPGLKMDRVGGYTSPAIRGITTLITEPGGDPNVATYIDGVYLANPVALTFDLPDVEQITVLKGPQGTLFGRNATGGAIQITTKSPSFTPTGELTASYGRFNEQSVKAYLSGPIVPDRLAASIALFEQTADSYYHNLTPSIPLRGVKSYFARGKILFTPSDDLKIMLQGYWGRHNDPVAEYATPYNGITLAQAFPGSIIPTKPRDVAENFQPKQNVLQSGTSLHLTWDNELGTITSILAYHHSKAVTTTPALNAALPAPYTGIYYFGSGPDTTKTAEINIASKEYGQFSYVAGAYYYDNKNAFDPLVVSAVLPGVTQVVTIFGRQTSKAYAIYGEASFRLTDKLTAIGGLRYSSEKRGVFGQTLLGSVPEIPGPWYNYGRKKFTGTTERFSLRYQARPDTNLYFTYSTGFKSGMFNAGSGIPFLPPDQCRAAAPACQFPTSVSPEKVKAYEIGVKTNPVNWLNVNGALFWYDYTNQQVNAYKNINLGGQTVALGAIFNAASSTIKGAELNVDAQVTQEFRIHAGLSLLDAKFDKFPAAQINVPNPGNVGTTTIPLSADGNHLLRAPSTTVNLSGVYTKDISAGTVSLTGNLFYSSRVYYDAGNLYSQKPYTTLGARASFEPSAVPNLTLSVWGNNLTGEDVILGTFITNNSVGYSYIAPATYGVSASYKF